MSHAWYRLTDDFGNSLDAATLIAIGPHDIAYLAGPGRPSYFVAVAPSGAEITRVDTSSTGAPLVYPTATGLGATFVDRPNGEQWMPPNGALWMPWVDLDGNPITDTRPYPTATVTDSGLEVRLGEREWLLAGEEWSDGSGLLTFPRSDGGVVVMLFVYGLANNQRVLELSTDGTIEQYFVNTGAVVGTARRLIDRRTQSATGPPRPSRLTYISSQAPAQQPAPVATAEAIEPTAQARAISAVMR